MTKTEEFVYTAQKLEYLTNKLLNIAGIRPVKTFVDAKGINIDVKFVDDTARYMIHVESSPTKVWQVYVQLNKHATANPMGDPNMYLANALQKVAQDIVTRRLNTEVGNLVALQNLFVGHGGDAEYFKGVEV